MAKLFLNGLLTAEMTEDGKSLVKSFDGITEQLIRGKSAIFTFYSHEDQSRKRREIYIPAGTVVEVQYDESERHVTDSTGYRLSSAGGATVIQVG